jgi:triosephosphate isomerase
MRNKILLGNWKMNLTINEAVTFAKASEPLLAIAQQNNIILGIAPTALAMASVKLANPNLLVSAQHVHSEPSGAFTGEISFPMLKDVGVSWALVGHSERRNYFAETTLLCNKKILNGLNQGFTLVYCVGETEEEHEENNTKNVIKDQVMVGLQSVSAEAMHRIIIAYEPVWSIGTGKNASEAHAQEIALYIRGLVKKMFGAVIADKVQILYGGSVKPNNIKSYLSQPDVDGALVGGASLKIESLKDLLMNMVS